MTAEIASIIGLVVVFIVGTLLPINMGAVAFTAAFIVGAVFVDMNAAAVLAGFPGDLFVTLVGITYLFVIAQKNGTVDLLVRYGVRAVRGHIAAIPWVMFFITAALTSIGAVSPAAVAIVAPIALRFAAEYRINPLLMGLLVIHGAQGGGFSPISIYGVITNQVVERAGLEGDPTLLFLGSLGFNFLIAVALFIVLGRGNGNATPVDAADTSSTSVPPPAMTTQRALTLVALMGVAIGALAFNLNVGFVAISAAVVLAILFPKAQEGAADKAAWSTVLLICGVITYIGVLQKAGTIEWIGQGAAGLSAPLIAALLLCYVAGVVSAFASSVAVLGVTIPLAIPLLAAGDLGIAGVIVAMAISTTVVDVSPFSTNGALVLANAPSDRDAFLRKLLIYTAVTVGAGPLLAWLAFVIIAGLF